MPGQGRALGAAGEGLTPRVGPGRLCDARRVSGFALPAAGGGLAGGLPPEPHGLDALVAVTPSVAGPVLAAVLLAWYARAVRRAGRRWPRARTLSWLAGVAVLLACTGGGVGAYARALAWVQAVQLLALLLVAPPLLALARPVALAAAADPRSRLARVTRGRAVRAASVPWLSPLWVPVALGGLYGTPLLLAADRHLAVRDAVHVALLVLGLLLAVGLVGDGVHDESPEVLGLAAALGLLELLLDALPGIAVRLAGGVLAAPYWTALHRGWGPSPLQDQHLAGAVLWTAGEALDLPFLVVVVARWMRSDARVTARLDADLDARAASAVAPVSEGSTAAGEPLLDRPWWETDPGRLGDRARGWRGP